MTTNTFITATRVYKKLSTGELKNQTLVLNKDAIVSVRANNRLGYPEHRTTILVCSGKEYDLANKLSEMKALLGVDTSFIED